MPHSLVTDGKILDWKFTKHKLKNMYVFSVGDTYVGQIFKVRNYWSVVGKTPNQLCPVDGFKTRYKAAEFLLKLEGWI